jgi:hypothetical protein
MKAASSSLSQGRWNYTGKVYNRQQRGDESVWRLLRDNSTGAQHMTECSITKMGYEPRKFANLQVSTDFYTAWGDRVSRKEVLNETATRQ